MFLKNIFANSSIIFNLLFKQIVCNFGIFGFLPFDLISSKDIRLSLKALQRYILPYHNAKYQITRIKDLSN